MKNLNGIKIFNYARKGIEHKEHIKTYKTFTVDDSNRGYIRYIDYFLIIKQIWWKVKNVKEEQEEGKLPLLFENGFEGREQDKGRKDKGINREP